jgi:hypothetical protein
MDMGREVDFGGVQRYSPRARLWTAVCSRQKNKRLRICCEDYDFMPDSDVVSQIPEIREDINWNLLCGFGFCATPQMLEGSGTCFAVNPEKLPLSLFIYISISRA